MPSSAARVLLLLGHKKTRPVDALSSRPVDMAEGSTGHDVERGSAVDGHHREGVAGAPQVRIQAVAGTDAPLPTLARTNTYRHHPQGCHESLRPIECAPIGTNFGYPVGHSGQPDSLVGEQRVDGSSRPYRAACAGRLYTGTRDKVVKEPASKVSGRVTAGIYGWRSRRARVPGCALGALRVAGGERRADGCKASKTEVGRVELTQFFLH